MMKKKKYLWVILATFQVGIFSTCSDGFESPPGSKIPEGAITVEEAKTFFEGQMTWIKNGLDSKNLEGWATNFTPQWSGAVISGGNHKVAVDVPILADHTFKVFIPGEGGVEDRKLFQEKVMQKLIVVKDLQTGVVCSYVVSIIPDKDYARSKKRKLSAMDFTNYGDRGNFSGWVIYSFPLSAVPLRVNYYQNGKQMDAASVIGLHNEWELQAAGDKMKEMLAGFRLKRESRVALRIWEITGPEIVIIGSLPDFDWEAFWEALLADFWVDYWDFWDWYLGHGGSGGSGDPTDPGDGSGGNPNNPPPSSIDVIVPNGQCVIGAIAAAYQAMFGGSAADAISAAINALNYAGVDTNPQNGGIMVSGAEMADALEYLGFDAISGNLSNSGYDATNYNIWFENGGYGIAHISSSGSTPGHEILLAGYNPSTGEFTYYDPVAGEYNTITLTRDQFTLIKESN